MHMSVEERLGLAHRALEEMWSDEAATDDRLHRFPGPQRRAAAHRRRC